MTNHRIRLRGPWEVQWLDALSAQHAGSGQPQQSERVHLPAEWEQLIAGRSGRVRLTRRFHKPSGLEPEEEVALVFDDLPVLATISLNAEQVGQLAGRTAAERIVVTERLQSVNTLEIELEINSASEAASCVTPWGQVAIEIRGG
jgi:hypothetical protein